MGCQADLSRRFSAGIPGICRAVFHGRDRNRSDRCGRLRPIANPSARAASAAPATSHARRDRSRRAASDSSRSRVATAWRCCVACRSRAVCVCVCVRPASVAAAPREPSGGLPAGFQSAVSPSQVSGSRPCLEPVDSASSTDSTACNSSVGDANLSSGYFASSCSTMWPNPGGSSGRNAVTDTSGSCRCASATASEVGPVNGGRPTS